MSVFLRDQPTPPIYTLSLHDALPIFTSTPRCSTAEISPASFPSLALLGLSMAAPSSARLGKEDRKSTRRNSSHGYISYAVFCLKKNKRDQARDGRRPLGRRCVLQARE